MKYDSDKQNLELKIGDADEAISNATGLVTKTSFNVMVTEIENKILDVTGLITSTNFNTKVLTLIKILKQRFKIR